MYFQLSLSHGFLVVLFRDAEPRLVHIEKKNTLGISIAPGNNGGIFVCSVSKGSVAEKAGLKYGDQLLEVMLYAIF